MDSELGGYGVAEHHRFMNLVLSGYQDKIYFHEALKISKQQASKGTGWERSSSSQSASITATLHPASRLCALSETLVYLDNWLSPPQHLCLARFLLETSTLQLWMLRSCCNMNYNDF